VGAAAAGSRFAGADAAAGLRAGDAGADVTLAAGTVARGAMATVASETAGSDDGFSIGDASRTVNCGRPSTDGVSCRAGRWIWVSTIMAATRHDAARITTRPRFDNSAEPFFLLCGVTGFGADITFSLN
jgi:hypothetical protein